MASLADSLDRVMAVQGVRAAALIDIETGMVVRSMGMQGSGFPAAAASLADEARLARAVLESGEATESAEAGDLDEISVVTSGHLHLCKILPTRPGDDLLLFVDLDRNQVNMALASLQVRQLAPAVLA